MNVNSSHKLRQQSTDNGQQILMYGCVENDFYDAKIKYF